MILTNLTRFFSKIQYVLSIILLFFTVFNFTWNHVICYPLILEPKTSKHCSETYFINNMGGYVWKPIHPVTIGENVLFYFNDTTGNCSTRFVVVRDIHRHYFPDYTVIQLEYPGFGISTHLPLHLENIIDECTFVLSNLSKQYNIKKCAFWGEGMGSYIMSRVIEKTPIFPNQIIFHNGVNDLYFYLFSKYKFLISPFFLFLKNSKHSSTYLKNTCHAKYYIITTQDDLHQYQSYEFYHEMKDNQIELLELEGKACYGILFEKNRPLLDRLFIH